MKWVETLTVHPEIPISIILVIGPDLSIYTEKISHSGYLWHVTPHGHNGKRRKSRPLHTVANLKSQGGLDKL